ncbi:hypothetical protein ml_178 [Mollivirus sibericum]|uniref:hypothetical protein n=1 Tax=Mollivirus sibericum TaxID=1678078 RepID=UPI0006B2E8B0|nr:hypothetical protein ml_178 [Mollivirus sibericum]ALD61980.1 hypothetical protein ml_178 [Mollivirus sibericum]
MRTSLVCLPLFLVFVLVLVSSASAGRYWGTDFLLWARAPEEWIRLGGFARVPRGADGIGKYEATPLKAGAGEPNSYMRYGFNFTLSATSLLYSDCKPTTVDGMSPNTVSCRSYPDINGDAHHRFRFVRPSWQTGDILEEGYPVFIQDAYTGKFCAIWPWPSNNAGMKCVDETPGEGTNLLDGHLFHFHWLV